MQAVRIDVAHERFQNNSLFLASSVVILMSHALSKKCRSLMKSSGSSGTVIYEIYENHSFLRIIWIDRIQPPDTDVCETSRKNDMTQLHSNNSTRFQCNRT